MTTANLVELQACLSDCIGWCGTHSGDEFVAHYEPQLIGASAELERAIATSDDFYLRWKQEEIEQKLAWKLLANELRSTQDQLRRVNASGFRTERLRHWDTEILGAAAQEMLTYLSEKNAIEGRDDLVEALERRLTVATSESAQEEQAYALYRRIAAQRSQALGAVGSVLYKFRGSMRRHLGKSDETYQSLRWPMSLNPDRSVL